MRQVHRSPAAGLLGVVALLVALTATTHVGAAGWAAGTAVGAGVAILLSRSMARHGSRALGPADRVTLVRAVGVAGVAALTVDLYVAGPSAEGRAALVALATAALLLDLVDGRVARRTGTASALGARFDMEVDALLLLVLSVAVARSVGPWVLAIGAARYLLLAARTLVPRLRGEAPPRPWCRVVAAVQGVTLTVAVAEVLPEPVVAVMLLAGLALLAESFGREAWQVWHLEAPVGREHDLVEIAPRPRSRTRRRVATALALVLLWAGLVLPADLSGFSAGSLVRIPLEGLVLVGLALVLPARVARSAAAVGGLLLGALVLLKALDIGFRAVLDRSFDPLADWTYLGPGVGVLGDSIGDDQAVAMAVGAGVAAAAVLVLMTWAAQRVARVSLRHRTASARAAGALAVAWVVLATLGLRFAPLGEVASATTASLARETVQQVRAGQTDRSVFADEIDDDRYADVPADRLLRGLRGKDVLLVFVESYGRVAVQGSSFAPGVTSVLDDGTRRLRRAGYETRTAFLTSPTFGAASWLAHATMQSGLWVDSERRYGQLLDAERLTLTSAFEKAGWRTVFDVPANTEDWPEGAAYYGFDQIYDSRNVGYAGPEFGYAPMPDQFTLAAFRRLELLRQPRRPVMAEIDLISSHHPWTPLPRLVPWNAVGDGSVFEGMPEQGESSDEVFGDPDAVRRVYGESIEYSWETLVSYLATYPDPDLVVIALGDHQPHTYVTGDDPGHDVPISVISRDPRVLDQVADWEWNEGLRPSPDATVWPMDAFRDRFLETFAAPLPSPVRR